VGVWKKGCALNEAINSRISVAGWLAWARAGSLDGRIWPSLPAIPNEWRVAIHITKAHIRRTQTPLLRM
jgi:hypothetical protein